MARISEDDREAIASVMEDVLIKAIDKEVAEILSGVDMKTNGRDGERAADLIVERGGLTGLGLWATELFSIAIARGAIQGRGVSHSLESDPMLLYRDTPIKNMEADAGRLGFVLDVLTQTGPVDIYMDIPEDTP